MTWEIKVWHEDVGERTRLSIEAGVEVPDEVISSIAGSYWFEEVQYTEPEWDETEGYDGGSEGSGQRLQG
jgi:hypothetical protein